MAEEEYTVGDVAKFLKKLRRKRHQEHDEPDDTNSLRLVFGKSSCYANNKIFYKEYLTLSTENVESLSTAVEDNGENEEVNNVGAIDASNSEESGSSEEESEEQNLPPNQNANEDEDEAPTPPKEKKEKKKKKQPTIPREKRTIFVGNIPTETQKKVLKKHFVEYGPIESVRMRSLAPAQEGVPQKVIGKTQDINSKRSSYNAYIVFDTAEAAQNALEKNGTFFQGHHLRVDLTDKGVQDKVHDSKRTIFLGSLPYSVNEEDVRRHFEDFGEMENVRVVRDPVTGMGKGFGFIVFKDSSSVALALKMTSQKLKGRRIRIKPIDSNQKKTERPKTSNTEEKALSNAERRINQKSLKRMRYKKKLKKNKPGGLDKVQINSTSAPQQKRSFNKQFNSKQAFSKPRNRKQVERKNSYNETGRGKRKREGIQTHTGKKTKFN